MANSSEIGFFDSEAPIEELLPVWLVGVRVDGELHVFDPAARRLPWDMLRLDVEGRQALVCEPLHSSFITLPAAGAERSVIARRMALECSATGDLAGECEATANGHVAELIAAVRQAGDAGDPDSLVRAAIASGDPSRHLRLAETLPDPQDTTCFRLRGSFRAADAATRTAHRMVLDAHAVLVSPAPRFVSPERDVPIELPMAWTEVDSVSVRIPDGWRVEAVDAPAERIVPGVLDYRCGWTAESDQRHLTLRRRLALGVGGRIQFPVSSYANLRALFEDIHQHDGVTVSLIKDAPR
jgi:hypothetical protein